MTALETDAPAGPLLRLDAAIAASVQRRRAEDGVDDRFRGLYISDAEVDGHLDVGAPTTATAAFDRRLGGVAAACGLDAFAVHALLVALAVDLDVRYERLYGYLHDDVSRRRASIGLALELYGEGPLSPLRSAFAADAPLVRTGLVTVEATDRPFLTRTLRVADRVAAHLVGDLEPDPDLVGSGLSCHPLAGALADQLAAALTAGARLIYVHDLHGGGGAASAMAAMESVGLGSVAIDLARIGADRDLAGLAAVAEREGRLRMAGLVLAPVEAITNPTLLLGRGIDRWPTIVVGHRRWDPAWAPDVPLIVEGTALSGDDRLAIWAEAMGGATDVAAGIAHVRLEPEQIWRAGRAAALTAATRGDAPTTRDLRDGARAQNASGLERLATRVTPKVGWNDLVVPPLIATQLRELVSRAQLGDVVHHDWGMRRGARAGGSLAVLFAGPSGVGKTLAAEVVAGELGLDLYTIDLATVVDKYIGETEKNLERIFVEAERVNGVIFFDEADALFGKRSDVKDARDRYANVEVAYLLQRMERFDGIAVLATNLRANLDEAFARRLDVVIDFPAPEPDQRRVLWDVCLGSSVPRADDVDLDFLAGAFELSGGNIRNVAQAAAFLAAADDRVLGMRHLIRAVQQEYRKLGRLCVEAEFGRYHELART